MNKVNIDALINREHRLDRDYVPNDLITLDENENNFHNYFYPELKPSISKVIYDDYKSLEEASIKDGLHIVVDSGFRDFYYQSKVWLENYKKNIKLFDGQDHADLKAYDLTNSLVAFPGTSEHQTGYAFDIGAYRNNKFYEVQNTDDEIYWMIDNSYKYGFILRYPKGKERITGFSYEPWHYRYVGKDISNIIYNNGDYLTLEEYHKTLKK